MTPASLLRRFVALATMSPKRAMPYLQTELHKTYAKVFANNAQLLRRRRRPEMRALARPLREGLEAVLTSNKRDVGPALALASKHEASVERYFSHPWCAKRDLCRAMFAVVRIVRPDIVVETGVFLGLSTYFVLSALAANRHGILHSIDMPPLDPAMRVEVGEAVPAELRDRWVLHTGASQYLLSGVLASAAPQVAVIDSGHYYRIMMREYQAAWEAMSPGGVLVSDDIYWNDAFLDFCDGLALPPVVVGYKHENAVDQMAYLGLLAKPR